MTELRRLRAGSRAPVELVLVIISTSRGVFTFMAAITLVVRRSIGRE